MTAVTQQPLPQQQVTKRIFVSQSGLDAASIVVLNGNTENDWEQFLAKIRREFGFVEESSIKISLADVNIVVTEADQLQSNDKVIAEQI